jgi:DNA mismatch repair protein MutL
VPKIRILPPELASQIAAGEVAERPSSVIKELIENALDAEAMRCDVEIDGGGILRLAVSDDGFGMSEEDARLALERHATSKLGSLADLTRVRSYGFRGEALPSIASVSRFCLRTRARGAESGFEVKSDGGSPLVSLPVGSAVGTRVEVNDLFFNIPARRKFLRSSATESGHVTEAVENAALSRPDVTFTLFRDGRRVREFLRTGSRAERVRQVLGEDALAPCAGERGPLRIEAHLSRPEAARVGAGSLHLFVNGRPVRDRALAVTVAHAYGSVLERGRYPRGAVYLDLPLELVDVNVHPQKAEVRFADPRALGDALYGILSRQLSSAFSLPPRKSAASSNAGSSNAPSTSSSFAELRTPGAVRVTASEPFAPPSSLLETRSAADPRPNLDAVEVELEETLASAFSERAPERAVVHSLSDSVAASFQPNSGTRWSSLRFVAQLRQTYLLCEGNDGIYLLDQHAAAERVTFTRLRKEYLSRAVPSQALLFPAIVEVSASEAELVEARAREFAEVGLDVRVRGPESVSVHAVPRLLARGSPERMLRDLLAEVTRKAERAFSDAVDLALATLACHGSIRAGDTLSKSEADALLSALDAADFAGHCPHGRPVVTFLGWTELERKVGRR